MSRPLRLLWFLSGVFCCLLALTLIPFKFNWEFKASESLQIVITIIIALLIQHYAVEKYSDLRAAKNILIQKTAEAASVLTEAHKLFVDYYLDRRVPPGGAAAMIAMKTNFSNAVYKIEQGMNKCNLQPDALKKVVSLRGAYCDILTGGNFPTAPYSAETYVREAHLYRQIGDSLEMLIYEINER